MGLLSNLLRKNDVPKRKIQLHLINLKNITKNIQNLYIGQIVSIFMNDNGNFSLCTYPEYKTIGYIRSSDEIYAEKYSHAILKEISKDSISACIICDNVYLTRLKININYSINNGDLLEIQKSNTNYQLKKGSDIIGYVKDTRINDELLKNICYISYDNGCALAVVYK